MVAGLGLPVLTHVCAPWIPPLRDRVRKHGRPAITKFKLQSSVRQTKNEIMRSRNRVFNRLFL